MSHILKLRPVLKTKEELEDEANLIFQLPRKTCEQIIPELKRLNNMDAAQAKHHRYHVIKKLLKKARIKDIDKHIQHMTALDAAEHLVPHGEVSKKCYNDIVLHRDFDLYGNMMETKTHPPRKFLELQALAARLKVEFTQKVDSTFLEVVVNNDSDEEEVQKVPKLQTEKWKIGHEVTYNAPVGLSGNPVQPFNSLGNENFYSYDGNWKKGKMQGMGRYLFRDGHSYEGEFHNNRPEGKGRTSYTDNQTYDGEWKAGRYEGYGESVSSGGSKYHGNFLFGRRHGHGVLIFASGLRYEGEFFDGRPHGRGTMTSSLTGWSYEGSFERGSICGSGVLITPPPASQRIVSYRSETKETLSLPSLVRSYLRELEEDRLDKEAQRNSMYGPLRGLQLKSYVSNIRNTLYSERLREKKQKYNDSIVKAKEQKAKLYEARLKALAGDEE